MTQIDDKRFEVREATNGFVVRKSWCEKSQKAAESNADNTAATLYPTCDYKSEEVVAKTAEEVNQLFTAWMKAMV